MAIIVCVQGLILLFNPFFGFISISAGKIHGECQAPLPLSHGNQRKPLGLAVVCLVHTFTLSSINWASTVLRAQTSTRHSYLCWYSTQQAPSMRGKILISSYPSQPSPVEPLYFMCTAQELATFLSQLLQGPPTLIQLLQENSNISLFWYTHNQVLGKWFNWKW